MWLKWKCSSRIDKRVIIISKVIYKNRNFFIDLNHDCCCWFKSWLLRMCHCGHWEWMHFLECVYFKSACSECVCWYGYTQNRYAGNGCTQNMLIQLASTRNDIKKLLCCYTIWGDDIGLSEECSTNEKLPLLKVLHLLFLYIRGILIFHVDPPWPPIPKSGIETPPIPQDWRLCLTVHDSNRQNITTVKVSSLVKHLLEVAFY